jgi:hypothetical protein
VPTHRARGLISPIEKKPAIHSGSPAFSRLALASPSRHIYNALTIASAFGRYRAFEAVRQRGIKVDGTFA